MPDLQRLIDEIRFRLQSQDWDLTDDVRGIAEEYASICREANVRLRRCGEFLKQGLRSEAVHLAEAEPRLLDLLATIDFPERADWDEMVAFYQLSRPDPLLFDVAEQLNEAYSLQQPLERLLDRHRLLALQRAPLPQRLAVLRRIAEVDAGNAVWEEDVRMFEKARLADIDAAARGAAEQRDAAALTAIAAELTQPGWRERPAKAQVERIRRLSEDVNRSVARRELEQLEPELNRALGELNVIKGRGLRDRWNHLAAVARLAANDPLVERVAPALGWIADDDARLEMERTFRTATAALEQVLERPDAGEEELRSAGHAVLKCERGIPEPLNGRYRERLRSLELSRQRRRRAIVIGAGLALVLIVGSVALIVQRSSAAALAKRLSEAAHQLIADGKFKEARELLDRHTGIADAPEVLETQRDLLAAESAEGDRAARFQELLNTADNASTAEDAHGALREARSIARLADEKLAAMQLEDRWQKVEATARETRERKFQEVLNSLAENVKKLESLHGEGTHDDDFMNLAQRSGRELAELKPQSKLVAAPLISQLNLLEARLERIRRVTTELQRKGALLDELTRVTSFHPGTPDANTKLQRAVELIQQVAKENPDDPRAADFTLAAKEIPELRGVLAWQQASDGWKSVIPPDIETARRQHTECRSWLDRYFHSPDASLAREYDEYLKSITAREESTGDGTEEGIRQALLDLYSGPLIDGLQFLETRDGRIYYLLGEQKFDKGIIAKFRYLVGFNGETKLRERLLRSDLVVDHTRPAPQSEIAKRVRSQLPSVALKDWDKFTKELAQSLIDNHKLDRLLQHFLLVKTLEYAGTANSLLRQELKAVLIKLNDDKIDVAAKWMNPDDEGAKIARQAAERALSLLGKDELTNAWKQADQRTGFLADQVRRRVHPIGWLSRGSAGAWSVRTNWSPKQKWRLIVAVPGTVESVLVWKTIGIADPQAGIKLDAVPGGILHSGRLVFSADVIEGAE